MLKFTLLFYKFSPPVGSQSPKYDYAPQQIVPPRNLLLKLRKLMESVPKSKRIPLRRRAQ
jgi:hypothetical protein